MWKRIKSGFFSFFHRQRLIRYGIYFLLLILLFIFRHPIMRGAGYWLIEEDQLEKADAIVVLGGSPEERGIKGAELFHKNYAPILITTGSNVSHVLRTVGLNYAEARLTKTALKNNSVPDSVIIDLAKGTSTVEEAVFLKQFAANKGYKKIILVTSKFHTARVHKYFNREFSNSSIKLIVIGAKPLQYKTSSWWEKEEGIMMVFNEYVKSMYYWWNY